MVGKDGESTGSVGRIIRQKEPENLEFPFSALDGFVTPTELFYVRSHFPAPKIDPREWRLKIEGCVEREIELTLADLKGMKAQTRTVTLECAGNSRTFLEPKEHGVQWELGAVSNAAWTGVPLGDVLERAGVKSNAIEIVFEGADRGRPEELPRPPEEIFYARGIPMAKVKDALLAYEMNEEALPEAHGAPVRAIVGGWYGMASVKWLKRIVVSDRPFRGYFESVDYSYWAEEAGNPVRVPITEMMVKAQIARPTMHEAIAAGTEYRLVGAAWTGDSEIVKVEVSTDGGKSFANAKLIGEAVRHAWRFWEYVWKTPRDGGAYRLMARATDARGNQQPALRDRRFGNYVVWHTLAVEVVVR